MTAFDISHTKKKLRTVMLEKRQAFVHAMSPNTLAALHQAIVDAVLNALDFPAGSLIAGYWPFQSEFDIRPLMMALEQRGHEICFPVTEEGQKPLIFKRWQPEMILEKGPFGVMIPPHDSPLCVPDILCVPLLAWDMQGHRLGYGQGHYDRTLAALRLQKTITAIGFGYECQYSEELPAEPLDQPLDAMVTEQRILKRDHETSLLR